jgi:hypothetical protein
MKGTIVGSFIATIALIALLPASSARAESLTGRVQTASGTSISGLTVYLIDPSGHRGQPELTNANGRFQFLSVQLLSSAYTLEIYWGQTLLYRDVVQVRGDQVLQTIILEE